MESCTGIFWVNEFHLIQARQGVHGAFLDYLREHGLWRPGNYYCAKNAGTPSTAIRRKVFEDLDDSAEIWLGVLKEGQWTIYRLNREKIRKGFEKKEQKQKDGDRLNVNEDMGEKI